MAKKITIDKEFLKICDTILSLNLTIAQWKQKRKKEKDYTLFHGEKYEGCFVPESAKFSFSFIDEQGDENEYLFELSLDQIKEIGKGEINFVW